MAVEENAMTRRRTLLFLGLLGAAALSMGTLRDRPALSLASAQPAQEWTVQAGGDRAAGTITLNAFMPSTLTIRAGDTINWSFMLPGTPHTVSFLAGTPAPPLVVPGPGMGELTLGPAFDPMPPGPPRTSASFDGTQAISSGDASALDEPNFRVTFTAPGIYPYNCLIHPGMNGVVEAVPAGATLPETPAQAQARGQVQAEQLQAGLQASTPMVQSAEAPTPGGVTTHTVAVGISSLVGPGTAGGASALDFLPRSLTVRRGDVVVWMVADPLEIHTITLPSGTPVPPFVDVRPPAPGSMAPLLVVPANVASPVGGPRYTGQSYFNSGIVGVGGGYILTIDAPAGTYEYLCVIHATPDGTGMRGTLIVTE
jgi:plastocyanin